MDESMEVTPSEAITKQEHPPENQQPSAEETFVPPTAASNDLQEPSGTTGIKRAAPRDDEFQGRKKICGPPTDMSGELEELMATIGDNADKNIVETLESLRTTLIESLETQESLIINIFARCIKFKPEKLTIYSTLAGLVNVSSPDFGKELINRIVFELNTSLAEGKFDIALRIITFVADLSNAGLITREAVANLLNQFTEFVETENLQTDFFVYTVLHTLPWIGRNFYISSPELLDAIHDKVSTYIGKRKKHHLKSLQVWTGKLEQEQEDYIDSLWKQILQLRKDEWNEEHILRVNIAFKNVLSESQKHDLPEVIVPEYNENTEYPLPRIVFRLFTQDDITDNDSLLPSADSIERFLVEEDLNWIISNNYLNWRVCGRELLSYYRGESIPLEHCIVEVIFGQIFRLPEAPYMELFYGALLIELCRKSANKMPQVLAHATQTLYSRSHHMQLVCVERFVNWFSYHLSNFQFRWSWNQWSDCVNLHDLSPKYIFVRETIEKCMRLSFYKKVCEILPEDFVALLPQEPVFKFVVDNVDHPAHEESKLFALKIRNKASPEEIILAVKRNEDEVKEGECVYDPDLVAIFTGTLLKLANQTFSHTFAALNKYHNAFMEFVKYADIMQPVLLRTIHECWGNHIQFIILIIDKLLKMQVFDPHIIIAWVFSGDLKEEIGRSWVWEVLNIAITRASKQYYLHKEAKDHAQGVYDRKVSKLESLKKNAVAEDSLFEGEEMDIIYNIDEEEEIDTSKNQDARVAALSDELNKAVIAHDKAADDLRNVVLDVCHKFSLAITENLYASEEEGVPFDTPFYRFLVGRFKEVLILHWREIFLYWKDVESELLNSTAIDDRIREIFQEFRALKY
uniref:Nuclear cap-binding protein subunit 1 n=1 Tax=Panagrolaimus sp. PS1159 TaxID=55785 RepID=A0AC35FLX5_9BILA